MKPSALHRAGRGVAAMLAAATAFAAAASAGAGELIQAQPGRGVAGRYVVVLRDGAAAPKGAAAAGPTVEHVALDLAARHRGIILHVYEHALQGFAAQLADGAAAALADDPRVAYVEQSQSYGLDATQIPASWGLDRVDQRSLPLTNSYTYDFTGAGVHAYIVDTGMRASHQEFGGRVGNGFTAIADGYGTGDCIGHGTHVAGTVGGTTYGVAKAVTLHPVRVFGCSPFTTTEAIVAGVDWVTGNHVKPAVANMSLGGPSSPAMNAAVQNSINAGVTYAVAAGNNYGADACGLSPAQVGAALTVGATAGNDVRAVFSNVGPCVDTFAPGVGITSAWHTDDAALNTIDGTSMASPHVAGVAALYLQQFGNQSPAAVHAAIVAQATAGVVIDAGAGSPNRLLHSLFGGGGGGLAPPATVTAFPECFGLNEVSWSAVPGATSYEAYHSASLDDFTGAVLFFSGPDQSASLNVASTRYVRVKACNGGGCSPLSTSFAIARNRRNCPCAFRICP